MRQPVDRWSELRVHGVGGSPGIDALGPHPPPQATESTIGPGTTVWRRNDGSGIEAFDWGRLSSSSPKQALWVLLLPFTLVNMAGYMLPRRSTSISERRLHGFLVHGLAVILTLTWTVWLLVAFVDLLGLQWVRQIPTHWMPNWMAETDRQGAVLLARAGMVAGLVMTALALWGLRRIAGGSLRSDATAGGGGRSPNGVEQDDLSEPSFFDQQISPWALWLHVGIAAAAVVTVSQFALSLDDSDVLFTHLEESGRLLMAAWLAQAIAVTALLVFALLRGDGSVWRRVSTSSAAAGALAYALTNAFCAALLFFLAKYALKWSPQPTYVDIPRGIEFGSEHALTDVWMIALVVAILLVGLGALVVGLRARLEELPTDLPAERTPLFAPTVRAASRHAQRIAAVGHAAPQLITIVAWVVYVWGLVAAIRRVDVPGWNLPQATMPYLPSAWRNAAALVLPTVVLGLILLMRRAALSSRTRRTLGTIWDVLTFWPRTFHPLGVRCSSAQIVPELREQLEPAVGASYRMASAHSQGSVLTYAALISAGDELVSRVCLVTYGSPLGTIYERLFPTYFNAEGWTALLQRLYAPEGLAPWKNFYRHTDPIGGPVDPPLEPDGPSLMNCALRDPAVGPLNVDADVDSRTPEPNRRTWGPVAGHSGYLHEPEIKSWSRQLRGSTSADSTSDVVGAAP